jgi:hypothetical protein
VGARRGGENGKRQPSAADRVSRAAARTPDASDAQIAARLGLSEATVRRHRRQPVDSASTPTAAPAPDGGAQQPGEATPDEAAGFDGSRRQRVDSLSTGDHDFGLHQTGPDAPAVSGGPRAR